VEQLSKTTRNVTKVDVGAETVGTEIGTLTGFEQRTSHMGLLSLQGKCIGVMTKLETQGGGHTRRWGVGKSAAENGR